MQAIIRPTVSEQHKLLEFCWIPSHKGIRGNEIADQLAKQALNGPPTSQYKVPFTDKFPQIKAFVKNEWQQYWITHGHELDNKLFAIMPDIGEYDVSKLNRKEQVLIHRIRIGHTRLTHSYLMDNQIGNNPPQCIYCNRDEMTVKHLMIHCTAFSHIRNRIYNVDDMKTLFDTIPQKSIIRFVKNAGFDYLF